MSATKKIEAAIETLPAQEIFDLLEWITDRHLKVLSATEFESPELEEELLKSLDSPRYVLSDELLSVVRSAKSAD